MTSIPSSPSRRDLLVFGVLLASFLFGVGLMLDLRWDEPRLARALWVGGGALVAAYFAAPRLRRPVYRGWMLATYPIGWAVSHALLAAIYYAIVTPVGLALRWTRRSTLARRIDRSAETYWTDHLPAPEANRYFRQF